MLVNLKAIAPKVTDSELERLSAENPETKFETNSEGHLLIMSPTGSESGRKNGKLLIRIGIWNEREKLGEVFDSSTGFKLSNGATKSPDVSWIENSRWQAIPKEQQNKFAPIDPDFVIELLSPSDDLPQLQQKMKEYMDCGVKLGWLINPEARQVEIYRQGQDKEVLDTPKTLSGESILPKLVLDLSTIF